MCVFNLAEKSFVVQNATFCTLKTVMCRNHSFQKLTELSQGNRVIDAPTSNTDGFLCRTHVFAKLRLKGLFRTNRDYLHLQIL